MISNRLSGFDFVTVFIKNRNILIFLDKGSHF